MNQEMPNWCTNSLTLTGKKEWIDALVKVSETDDKDIFMYLRPCMEDAEWYSDKWYSWNCDNWGTKWDADNLEVGSCDGECIELHFESAWSPPIALYEYLVENGWEVKAYYYEEGMQFCGNSWMVKIVSMKYPPRKSSKKG